MWMTNELLPKIWIFLGKIRWSPSPSKLEGPHEVILGDIPIFMEEATCALSFFPKPSSQVVQNRHLVPRTGEKKRKKKENTHPNWASYEKDIGF